MVWSDEKWLGSRANFHLEAIPANLRVDNVQVLDSGQYRCRVDFTEAPTQNTIVNLTKTFRGSQNGLEINFVSFVIEERFGIILTSHLLAECFKLV